MNTQALRDALTRTEHRVDHLKRTAKRRLKLMDPLKVLPYRTWIDHHGKLWLRGRVLEDKGIGGNEDASIWRNVRDTFHRYESDEMPGAEVTIDLGDRRVSVTTDAEGFFDLQVDELNGLECRSPWTDVAMTLRAPLIDGQEPHRTSALVRHVGPEARLGVISDMDDTVIRTGANDFLKRLRVELFNNAHSREPFAGVARFYRALSARERNPFFYVSSSPWNLADLFDQFMVAHDIPPGPILLKEMGLERDHWIKSGHDHYKAQRIERIMDAFPQLSFILVGDSGQRDPFIYRDIVERRGDRVLAIYIRDVSDDAKDAKVREVIDAVAERGIDMLLMESTADAAVHAHERGWIDDAALADVRRMT